MSNFNDSRRGGGRDGGSFGGGSRDRGGYRSGGRDRSSFGGGVQMHKAVCDECGKDCEVPFAPTSGKPIYCSECFEKRGGKDGGRDNRGGFGGGSRERSFGGGRRDDRGGSRSFGGGRDGARREPSRDNSSEKIEALGSRLNKVFELLEEIKDRQIKMEGSCNCITEESPKKATKKKVAVKKAEVKADKKAEKKAKKVVKKVAKK